MKERIAMAYAMAALHEQSQRVETGYISYEEPEPLPFTLRPTFDYPALTYYDKDLPNFRKHRETCLKNRRKRKARKRRK